MEKIELQKSTIPPVRPPRKPKVSKLPQISTARVIPNIQPPPNRNPFDPPSPPIFRHRTQKESCTSYIYTNDGILWNDKELSMCFVKPTPKAPPTSTENTVATEPNSLLETRPPTLAIQRLVNDLFSTEPNSRQQSPIPPEDVWFVLDRLFQQQAARHPEANHPFLFLNPAEVAPEFDLPEDIWDLF